MKNICVWVALLALTACAHTRFESFHGNEFTVCGNKWCDRDCWKEVMEKSCSGAATLTGMESQVAGEYSNASYNTLTRSTSGYTVIKKTSCRTYSCSGAVTPWE
jgi:hypothetical protein